MSDPQSHVQRAQQSLQGLAEQEPGDRVSALEELAVALDAALSDDADPRA